MTKKKQKEKILYKIVQKSWKDDEGNIHTYYYVYRSARIPIWGKMYWKPCRWSTYAGDGDIWESEVRFDSIGGATEYVRKMKMDIPEEKELIL